MGGAGLEVGTGHGWAWREAGAGARAGKRGPGVNGARAALRGSGPRAALCGTRPGGGAELGLSEPGPVRWGSWALRLGRAAAAGPRAGRERGPVLRTGPTEPRGEVGPRCGLASSRGPGLGRGGTLWEAVGRSRAEPGPAWLGAVGETGL